LFYYLLIYAIRLLLVLPLNIWNHVFPSETPAPESGRDREETTWERLENLLDILGTLWFIIGNWFVFTSRTCSTTGPILYHTSLSLILVDYVILLFPLIIIMAIIFCLPVVLVALRFLHTHFGLEIAGDAQTAGDLVGGRRRPRGTTESVLKQLSVDVYRPGMMSADDATCSICLGNYVEGEELKFLPTCRHHFHASCIDSWLVINKNCALCLRDVEQELRQQQPATVAAT
jgi:hypothetical protein